MVSLGTRLAPSLQVRDMAETVSFYTETLGFRLTGCGPDQAQPTWAEVTRDGIVLMFFSDPPLFENGPALSGTLYVWPDDVPALYEELAAKGAEIAWGPEVMSYGMREFAVRDPNGYLIGFWEPTVE